MWTMFETRFHWFGTRKEAWFTYQTQKKKKNLVSFIFVLEKNQLFGEGKKIACKADSGNSIPREPRFTFVGRKGKPNDFSYNRWSSGNIIISRFYGFHVGFPPRPVSVVDASAHWFSHRRQVRRRLPSVGGLVANFVILPKILDKFSQKKNPNLFKFSS